MSKMKTTAKKSEKSKISLPVKVSITKGGHSQGDATIRLEIYQKDFDEVRIKDCYYKTLFDLDTGFYLKPTTDPLTHHHPGVCKFTTTRGRNIRTMYIHPIHIDLRFRARQPLLKVQQTTALYDQETGVLAVAPMATLIKEHAIFRDGKKTPADIEKQKRHARKLVGEILGTCITEKVEEEEMFDDVKVVMGGQAPGRVIQLTFARGKDQVFKDMGLDPSGNLKSGLKVKPLAVEEGGYTLRRLPGAPARVSIPMKHAGEDVPWTTKGSGPILATCKNNGSWVLEPLSLYALGERTPRKRRSKYKSGNNAGSEEIIVGSGSMLDGLAAAREVVRQFNLVVKNLGAELNVDEDGQLHMLIEF